MTEEVRIKANELSKAINGLEEVLKPKHIEYIVLDPRSSSYQKIDHWCYLTREQRQKIRDFHDDIVKAALYDLKKQYEEL